MAQGTPPKIVSEVMYGADGSVTTDPDEAVRSEAVDSDGLHVTSYRKGHHPTSQADLDSAWDRASRLLAPDERG